MENNGITEQTVKDAIKATLAGFIKWVESDEVIIQDKNTKELLPDAELESIDRVGPLEGFIIPELLKYGIEYSAAE